MMKELPPLRFLAVWLGLCSLPQRLFCSALQKLLRRRMDTNDEALCKASIDSRRVLRLDQRHTRRESMDALQRASSFVSMRRRNNFCNAEQNRRCGKEHKPKPYG